MWAIRPVLAGFLRPRTPRSKKGSNEGRMEIEEGRNEAPTALAGGHEAPSVEEESMAAVVTSTDAAVEEGRNAAPAAAVVPSTVATAEVGRNTAEEGSNVTPTADEAEEGRTAAPTAGGKSNEADDGSNEAPRRRRATRRPRPRRPIGDLDEEASPSKSPH